MARRGKVIRFPGRGKSPQPEAAGPQPKAGQGPAGRQPDDGGFVEVRRCRDQAEALVVKSLFESKGIPCLLRSHLVHSVHPFTVGDQGAVIVLVPAADAPHARVLLARISSGPSSP